MSSDITLCCSSWSYHRSFEAGQFTLPDWIRFCRSELELEAIEIESGHFPATTSKALTEIRKLIEDNQLSLADVTTFNDFGFVADEQNRSELDKVFHWIDIARELGSSLLRVFAGWPKGQRELQWNNMLDYLRRAANYAGERGITLVLENHNHGGFIRTAEDALCALQAVASPFLRLNLDTGNYIDGMVSIEKTVHLARHVHAKLLQLDGAGREIHIDHARVLELLRRAGYRGFFSAEYEGDEAEQSAVPRGLRYLRNVLSEKA